jgi:hypothetical protein
VSSERSLLKRLGEPILTQIFQPLLRIQALTQVTRDRRPPGNVLYGTGTYAESTSILRKVIPASAAVS